MKSLGQYFRKFGRKEIWSWPLFWFALPFFFSLSFFFDVFLGQSYRIEWLTIAVVTLGVVTVLGIAVKLLIVDKLFRTRDTGLLNFILIALIGAIKNVLVGEMAFLFGLVDSVDWAFRIYGGAGLALALLIGFVATFGTRIDHNANMAQLLVTRENLLNHRAQSEKLLADEKSLLLKQTQNALLPRLDQIQQFLITNLEPSKVVQQLREFIQSEVRPLSEALTKAAKNLTLRSNLEIPKRTRYRLLQDRLQLKSLIRPSSMLIFLMLGSWFLSYIILGFEAANWSLLFSLGSWVLIVISRMLIPTQYKTKPRSGIWLLFVIGFIAANPLYWPLKEFSRNLEQDLLLLLVVVNVIGCVVGVASNRIYQLDGFEIENLMARDNDALEREVVLFEQQMWIARRNWSFVVHGTVQAALTAAITRLSSSEEPEQFQVDLALQDIERAANALSQTPDIDVDLNVALQNISSTWDGICKVAINLTDRATRALARNPEARICVNEICKEAVSNAVRHGEANVVDIEIDRTSDEVLFITASNDGRSVEVDASPGVGSRMLDDLTIDWSLNTNRSNRRTILVAQVPLAPAGY